MTAVATAPARPRVSPGRGAPRPTPRSAPAVERAGRAPSALRVVEAPPRRYPARAVAVVAVLLVFGSMLASAIFHSVLVSGQDRIDVLGRRITAAEKGLAQDRLELARMSSPERIATEAERLGLVVADRQTWIRPGSTDEPVVTGGETATADTADDDAQGSTNDPTEDGEPSAGSDAEELAATDGGRGVQR